MTDSKTMTVREKRLSAAVIAVCCAFLIVFSIINFCGFERMATQDMYEDTLCAKVMWEKKSLFPDSYAFGNQLYVAATPVLCALIYGLCGSLNTAMAVATSLMTVLILAALFYMLSPFVKNRLSVYIAALTLMGCAFAKSIVGMEECQLFFVMCSFYACYLITAFVVCGDYLRAIRFGGVRPGGLILSVTLCFAMGMQSLRQTCVTVLPVLAYEFMRVLIRRIKTGEFLPRDKRASFFRALAYAGANLAGIVFIKLLKVPQYTIYSGASVFNGASVRDKLYLILRACTAITGYDFIVGEEAWFFAVVFAVNIVLVMLAAISVIRSRKCITPLHELYILTVISIAAVIAASVVTSVNLRPIYIFMYYPLVMLSAVIVADASGVRWRCVLTALLCAVYGANLYFSYSDNISEAFDDSITPAQEICRLALDNGYSIIYGEYETTAPEIAVWSDGKLIAAGWNSDTVFEVIPYVNVKNVYGLKDYDKGLFVFTDRNIDAAFGETDANGTTLTFVGEAGIFHAYSSSNQLMYPLSWVPY